jgi:hypothetical protein
MPLLTDPDFLSQGNTTSTYTTTTTARIKVQGATPLQADLTIISGDQPTYSQYDYFEIRSATSANNNGLYQVITASDPNYTVKKITGSEGSLSNTAVSGDTTMVFLGDNVVAGNNTPGTALNAAAQLARGKSVYFDTYNKRIWLLGDAASSNLNDDGVTLQALYSFTKEEWKNDPFLIKFDFPFTAITPEQFEIGSGTSTGWQLFSNTVTTTAEYTGINGNGRKTEELIRTGGWSEFDTNGTTLLRQYAGVITLGTFNDPTDRAYYQQGNDPTDTNAKENFVFADAVNEGVKTYNYTSSNNAYGVVTYPHSNTINRDTGSWVTEGYQVGGKIQVVTSDVQQPVGTYTIESVTATDLEVTTDPFNANTTNDKNFTSAWDNRNVLNLFLRANSTISQSKSYDSATLADIGVSTLTNQVYRFPLTNSPDVKITGAGAPFETDGDITQAPWDGDSKDVINIKYFDTPFKARIDSNVLREFGIVVDSGTFSGQSGSATLGSASFNTGVTVPGGFEGGELIIYDTAANSYSGTSSEVSDSLKYTITGISGTTVSLDENLRGSGTPTNISFALERSSANNTANSVPTSIENIYAAIQYQLRQDANINKVPGGNTVNGSTADELLGFVGDVITSGSATSAPTNPEGGGTGVFLNGFQSADINDIRNVDNIGEERRYPLSVSVTLSFNDNLQNDGNAKFWLFYDRTARLSASDLSITVSSGRNVTLSSAGSGLALESGDDYNVGDYIRIGGFTNSQNNGSYRIVDNSSAPASLDLVKVGGDVPITESAGAAVTVDQQPVDTPSALLVQSTSFADITGDVSGPSFTFNYAYDLNDQGARDAGDGDASVVARAIGFNSGQFVETDDTIESSAKTISIVAGLERNYSNP